MCTGRVGLRESKMRLYFTESERERARALAALLTLLLFSSFGTLCGSLATCCCCACSLSVVRRPCAHGSPFLSVLDILEFTLYALDAASGRGIGYLCRVPRGAVGCAGCAAAAARAAPPGPAVWCTRKWDR